MCVNLVEDLERLRISNTPKSSEFDKNYLYWIVEDYIFKTIKVENKTDDVLFAGLGVNNEGKHRFNADKKDFEIAERFEDGFKNIAFEDIFNLVFKSIDIGEHKNKYAIRDLSMNLAFHIEAFCLIPMSGSFDGNLENFFDGFYKRPCNAGYTCSMCGEHVIIKMDCKNGKTAPISGIDIPKCYFKDINKTVEVMLTGSSGKYVVANDFRGLLSDKSIDDDIFTNINYPSGIEESIILYSKIGILTSFVGNNCLRVYTKDNKLILTNKEDVDFDNEYGSVSCGLWWIMVTAIENVDMALLEESGQDYCIVSDAPNIMAKFRFNKFDSDYLEVELDRN